MDYDAILVLAGGMDNNGQIHEWVKRRLDDTILFFNQKNVPIICLGGGTYHKSPILNENGFIIHESTACANYLKSVGNIDYKNIFRDWSSYDTIGNVYFSLVNHVRQMDIRNILVITSTFHMKRVELLFNWIYNFFGDYNLYFHESSDDGLNDILEERINRETKSIEIIQINLIPCIKNLSSFHKWLYTEHNVYSSDNYNIEIIDKNILKTY